jgi:hypothetical protein
MLKRYEVKPETRLGPWGIFIVDTDRGILAVVSDFGNYAYLWTDPGCEFRAFLLKCEEDYLVDKLVMGRPDRDEYDPEATERAVKAAIKEHEGDQKLEKLILEEHDLSELESFHQWLADTHLREAHDLVVYVPNRQCSALLEKVWPRFRELLKKELEEEAKKKARPKIVFEGVHIVAEDQCPNCCNGTLEQQGVNLACRGGCGAIFYPCRHHRQYGDQRGRRICANCGEEPSKS